MRGYNPVLFTTKYVFLSAKDVSISRASMAGFVKKFAPEIIKKIKWSKDKHFALKNDQMLLDYLTVLDSLNFCFWPKSDEEKWSVNYNEVRYTGYFALAVSLKKFFEENQSFANMRFFSEISFGDFLKILNGHGSLQFLEERYDILRLLALHIVRHYNGRSVDFFRSCGNDAKVMIVRIVEELPFFKDASCYKNAEIFFWKRAQILVSDIYSAFDGRGLGNISNMGYLTAFADYRLPQFLRHFGIIVYSPELEKAINKGEIIERGSKWEIEIRSVTIWAVEFLKMELAELGIVMSAREIDWWLWEQSKRLPLEIPYHLTPTIHY